MPEKEFTLKYKFEDVANSKKWHSLYSPEEEHSGVGWKIEIRRNNEHLGMYLNTNVTENQEIRAEFTLKIFSKTQEKSHIMSASRRWRCPSFIVKFPRFISWETMKNEYLNNGELAVEVDVKIKTIMGFKNELRSFGEEMQQFSDVILKVKDRKFYVSKLYLSSHSPYFSTLFLGKFQESEKSEIELKDVNPHDFQYYLEVLYGENRIDEDTVQGILSVADMFDTPLIIKKCEEFLVEKSKMDLKHKLELAGNYRMKELQKICLEKIKSKEDIRSVIPENLREMDPEIVAELLKKSLAFD